MLRRALIVALLTTIATAQTPQPLDPSVAVTRPQTIAATHQLLPEQYIWTANDAAVATNTPNLSRVKLNDFKVDPHYFRRAFTLDKVPPHATLYLAGPREAYIWINGAELPTLTYTPDHHMGFGTMTADVSAQLHAGRNTIAIAAIRGYGSHHHTNALKTAWLNSGEVLTAKILPAAPHIEATPILITGENWRSTTRLTEGWNQPTFDDSQWPKVESLGPIESSPDFFQWNADAGLYDWPGYIGAAPYMATLALEATHMEAQPNGDQLLDFGREINGRIVLDADHPMSVRVSYGESLGELRNAPHFPNTAIEVVPHTPARGPKTGFRYALIHFATPSPQARIAAEVIYYPSKQIGNFTSSDPLVNRIFDSAVYTAHLSMQDSILDGIKRDRGRWIGDDEVIDRTILDVYGNVPIVKAGLEDALGPAPVTEDINGLPGYSAWWIVAEYEYIQRTNDLDQLRALKPRIEQLLTHMAAQLDDRNIYAGKGKPFVDWSSGFSTDTPEACRAVHFEYLYAFSRAAMLFGYLHDEANGKRYLTLAKNMAEAATKYLEDPDGNFGDRWQTNAIAYLDHAVIAWPLKVPNSGDVWQIFKRTTTGRKPTDIITPYYGSYLLQAMTQLGGTYEPLQWMKSYWGSMLDNGATSFWEAWDPAWASPDPHAKLQADDKTGYYTSLSHGWSSGPASFLLEQVLGVTPAAPGYASVKIRPILGSLAWAKGTVATPLGPVHVEASETGLIVDIPATMHSTVHLPMGTWTRNGAPIKFGQPGSEGITLMQNGEWVIDAEHGGHFEFLKQQGAQ